MIVVDASALLEFLLGMPAGQAVSERIFRPGERLAAPHLIDVEVAQVLRRYRAAGDLSERRAREALTDLADMTLTRYPHLVLLERVWELRKNLTAYDAVYVALAEMLQAPLVTRDAWLSRASGVGAVIELL